MRCTSRSTTSRGNVVITRILTFSSLLRTLPSLCVLGSLLSLGMAQTVFIPERVEVTSESLSLGDIARIEPWSDRLSEFPIGYSPYPGHYRWLEKSYLMDQLKKGAVDLRDIRLEMPQRILITRQSQIVGRSVIIGAVRDAFDAHRSRHYFRHHENRCASGRYPAAGRVAGAGASPPAP